MATTKTTTLDTDNTKPSVTEPGDGPADTTDPTERASTVGASTELSDEAKRAGTVNAVTVLPIEAEAKAAGDQRIERYEARKPDGTVVTVEHNLDTGESTVTDAANDDEPADEPAAK